MTHLLSDTLLFAVPAILGRLGGGEMIVLVLVILLLFGARRLPALAEAVGKSISSLKRGLNTNDDIDVTPADKQVESQTAPSARDEVGSSSTTSSRNG